ncbi:SusD family protein [bacterium A37T11]|nr:SusD family protein [bacterium A37T11]
MKQLLTAIGIGTILLLSRCSKEDFLNTKPEDYLVIPETLEDFQALLDNDRWMNGITTGTGGPNPSMGEVGSDNLFFPDVNYVQVPISQQNVYTWQSNIYSPGSVYDWEVPYRVVFYSNVVLEGIGKMKYDPSKSEAYNNIKGAALFFRSSTFYQLAQVFASRYEKDKAESSLGIPLRLQSDVNILSTRATIKDTYDRIISDLKASISLLPLVPVVKTRPSKPATYGLLSRVFLAMENYDESLKYADSCLAINNSLMNYNELPNTTYPIQRFNSEVIFASALIGEPYHYITLGRIDTILYKSYSEFDLRKSAFFRVIAADGYMRFRGSYNGSSVNFAGIATDEIYLNKAECLARMGSIDQALDVLNRLLKQRFTSEGFEPVVGTNANQVLGLILEERRKELVMRGLRWTDLRRLNKDDQFAKTLTRVVNGISYSLPPNDLKYTLPIPYEVVSMTGMIQNER